VAVSGTYAYLAEGTSYLGTLRGLQVIEISDPESPQIVGSVDTPGFPQAVAVSGSYAYVADFFSLQVIDITDPRHPQIVGSVDTPGHTLNVAVSGTYAFVADDGGYDGRGSLQVIEISDPRNPRIVGSMVTPGHAGAVGVAGSYAYLAESDGLHVVDITNPERPALVGECAAGSASGVAVSETHVYMTGRIPGGPTADGLAILPVQCESTPVSLDFSPNTLNLHSMGRWVTATLEPDPPASPADIDVASILLNDRVPVDESAPVSIGDTDGDGRPDLTVKFDRAAVQFVVGEGDAVGVTVAGNIAGGVFEATDVIRVVRGHVTAPAEGSALLVPHASFALQGAIPNPGRGLRVSFSLASAGPATLAVYDVTGRKVAARQVGRLGPGRHVVSFERPGLAPGVYLVHLSQGSRNRVARAVVVQ